MKRRSDITVPATAEVRLAQGLCPIHGVKLETVGRGADGLGIFSCPVRQCKIEASASSLTGPFDLLKSSQNLAASNLNRGKSWKYKN